MIELIKKELKCGVNFLYVGGDQDSFLSTEKVLKGIKITDISLKRASTVEAAIKMLFGKDFFHLCLFDYILDDEKEFEKGMEFVDKLKSLGFKKPIIMLINKEEADMEIKYINSGDCDCLLKKDLFSDKKRYPILEKSIIYNLEREALRRKTRQGFELKKMILNMTVAGIIVTDFQTDMFLEFNNSFLKMFNLKKEDIVGKKFNDFFKVREYNPFSFYCDLGDVVDIHKKRCGFSNGQKKVQIETINGQFIDCLVQSDSVSFKNGKKRTLYVTTFIDISKQQRTQKNLLKIQKDTESLIRDYGLENKKPEALMRLIGIELNKFESNEERE